MTTIRTMRTGAGMLALAALMLFFSLQLSGCSDEDSSPTAPESTTAPALPDASQLQFDFSFFDSAEGMAVGVIGTLLVLWTGHAAAGGGPETTLLVVNADSPLSLRIANEYVRLRNVPQSHVLWLHDVPSGDYISIAFFRENI